MNSLPVCCESDSPLAVTGSSSSRAAFYLFQDGFSNDDFQGCLDRPDCIASGSHCSFQPYSGNCFSVLIRCSISLQ